MLIWELHRDLSNAIGDPVRYNIDDMIAGRAIPDGVRYSKVLRDSYLYRAAMEIQRQIAEVIAGMPNNRASLILEQLHPTNKRTNSFDFNNPQAVDIIKDDNYDNTDYEVYTLDFSIDGNVFESNTRPMFLLNARYMRLDGNIYPLPIKTGLEVQSLINSRNVQRADDFLELTYIPQRKEFQNGVTGTFLSPVIRMYLLSTTNAQNEVDKIILRYVPFCGNPSYLKPEEFFNFEETQKQKLLSLASMYAYQDSQEEGMIHAMAGLTNQPINVRGAHHGGYQHPYYNSVE